MSVSPPRSPTSTGQRISDTYSPGDVNSINEEFHDLQSFNEPTDKVADKSISGIESMIRFLLLPSQIFIVLLLEFLNSFRSFGLRFILYNYITNEYGISDTQAGILLGIKGFVDIGFGLAGSILVDIMGVRWISLVALGVALIGRTLLAFGRSKVTLFPALFVFSPCGDALLSTGLYAVALKKLTTPLTRPLAFAISYATFNLAGAFADIILDKMRASVSDYNGTWGVYTAMRQFVVLTWVVLILTFLIAYFFLRDLSVVDPDDLDCDQMTQGSAVNAEQDEDQNIPIDTIPAKPIVETHTLRKWFPNQRIFTPEYDAERSPLPGNSLNIQSVAVSRLPSYKVYATKTLQMSSSPRSSDENFLSQVVAILRLRNTWIVIIFGFLTMAVGMNWSASEIVLPPYLERRFGELTPIYTVQSINLILCLILPPFVASMTSDKEVFQIIMPGLWLMAASPVLVAISPNMVGACLWQVFMTFGEVLWSPRQDSWTADLAPTGKEGLFFAVSRARALLSPIADFALGYMNDRYNTNCNECRDQYGHFCDTLASEENSLQCKSIQEDCELFLDNQEQTCPSTCLECPTWDSQNPSTLWYILMIAGLISPLSVWICLPFLRGKHEREERFYGLCSLGKHRLMDICGFSEEQTPLTTQFSHTKVRRESYDSNEVSSSPPLRRQSSNDELI